MIPACHDNELPFPLAQLEGKPIGEHFMEAVMKPIKVAEKEANPVRAGYTLLDYVVMVPAVFGAIFA